MKEKTKRKSTHNILYVCYFSFKTVQQQVDMVFLQLKHKKQQQQQCDTLSPIKLNLLGAVVGWIDRNNLYFEVINVEDE